MGMPGSRVAGSRVATIRRSGVQLPAEAARELGRRWAAHLAGSDGTDGLSPDEAEEDELAFTSQAKIAGLLSYVRSGHGEDSELSGTPCG